jgi:hypothetical protein
MKECLDTFILRASIASVSGNAAKSRFCRVHKARAGQFQITALKSVQLLVHSKLQHAVTT